MAEITLHDMPIPRSDRTDYLALDEAAEHIGTSQSILEKLVALGQIRAIDIDGMMLVRRSQLDEIKRLLAGKQQDAKVDPLALVDAGILKAFAT